MFLVVILPDNVKFINCALLIRYDHTSFLDLRTIDISSKGSFILNQWMSLGPCQSFIYQMVLRNGHCPVSKIFKTRCRIVLQSDKTE